MFVAFIIVAIVSVYLALNSQPKAQTPQPKASTVPTVKDGKRVIRVYGTVWIDDPMQIAMKQVGEDPIKSKGGKK